MSLKQTRKIYVNLLTPTPMAPAITTSLYTHPDYLYFNNCSVVKQQIQYQLSIMINKNGFRGIY